jgi:WD40 repeat protein
VYGVAFRTDGKQVFSSGRDNRIRVWNAADGNAQGEIGGFGGEVYKLRQDADRLFAPSADKLVRQIQQRDRSLTRTFAGHTDWVFTVAVHAATNRIAAGCYDGRVRVWSLDEGKELLSFIAAPGIPSG